MFSYEVTLLKIGNVKIEKKIIVIIPYWTMASNNSLCGIINDPSVAFMKLVTGPYPNNTFVSRGAA